MEMHPEGEKKQDIDQLKNQDRTTNRQSPLSFVKTKKGATALLATAALLAVALVVSVWTGAWQIFNRKSQRNELQIVSDSTQLAISGCSIYYGEIAADGTVTGKLMTDDSGSSGDTGSSDAEVSLSKMNQYDAVVGRNDDTAIFIRLSLTGDYIKTGGPIDITVTRENTGVLDDENATDTEGFVCNKTIDTSEGRDVHCTVDCVAPYLSNIVTARILEISSAGTATDADTIYKACKDSTNWDKLWDESSGSEGTSVTTTTDVNSGTPFSFFDRIPTAYGRHTTRKASDEGAALTKSGSFTATLSGYTPTTSSSGATTAVFFIRLDYEQALVEVYLNENNGGSFSGRLNKHVTDNFIGDISLITISEGSTT